MADGFVQLPPDSTGKKLRVFGPLAAGDYAEGVALVDANGDQFPESAKYGYLTSVGLAAGASVSIDSADVTVSTTGRLIAVIATASVPLKVLLRPVLANAAQAYLGAMFSTDARLTERWSTPHPNFIRLAGGTNNKWRAELTNQDNIDAADVYVTFYWDEVS